MAKTENLSFWGELSALSVYKRSQGRMTRQITAVAIGGVICIGAYTLSQSLLMNFTRPVQFGLPVSLAVVGAWFAFRLVNYPRFAEFLIAVEAEMNKVSWASRAELIRATLVVLFTMFFLGFVLYLYDFLWMRLLSLIGVLQIGE